MRKNDDNNDEKNDKQKRDDKPKKWARSTEHKSDRRTAEFVVRKIGDVQEHLSDLIPDLRTFEHYSEIEDLGWCLMLLQRLKKKYRKYVEHGTWED